MGGNDFAQILAGAVVLGSTLGATVAGFFAYRQKSLVTLLRESNSDYKDRNEQLESERDELKRELGKVKDAVDRLEKEKRLPLEKLTQLIVQQHTAQLASMNNIATKMGDIAQAMSKNNGGKK